MTTLTLLALTVASQVCISEPAPRLPTVAVYGDSRMHGNLCSSGTGGNPASPAAYVDANLPGGVNAGWFVKNAAVSGYTPAQVLTTYNSGESTLCNGERCFYLIINGGVNCLRTGTPASTCIVDTVTLIDDALTKYYAVIWLSETEYGSWASAGPNPAAQLSSWMTAWQAACAARATNPNLRCLDITVPMGNPLQNTCDGVHQTQAGTDLLGSLILNELLAF